MIEMKHINFFISALAALTLTACSLKEHSYTEVSMDVYPESASEALTVLQGCYRDLCEDGLYGYYLSLLFTISSDIAQCEGSSNTSFRVIPTNSHNASTAEIQTSWSALYNAIYNVNSFIEKVQERMPWWSNNDQEFARAYIAEAKTLRALYYFELVRWWGNVPLITSTAEHKIKASEITQATPVQVYNFIEKDLLEAQEALPWAEDRADSPYYRMSKGSALGLLLKVYCTWAGYPVRDESKWAEAAAIGRRMVESGKHRLNPSFEDVWVNTCTGKWDLYESLIEVSFYYPSGLNSEDCVGRIGKWNGVVATSVEGIRGRNAGNWKVVYPFVEQWKTELPDDPRIDLSVADYRYGYSNSAGTISTTGKIKYFDTITKANPSEEDYNKQRQLFTPAKWDTEKYTSGTSSFLTHNDMSNINWYVLRYADVLLLFAEAENEVNGPTAAAYSAFNLVRQRAFGNKLHNLPDGLSKDQFREEVRKERARELCFEGHRKQDLIRWGIYYDTIKQTEQKVVDWFSSGNYSVSKYTIEGRHELLPIPQKELDLMKKCHQNDGWE